jgi:DNA topoisomerase-2
MTEAPSLKERKVDNYSQLSGKQHVYTRPDTYVGSVEPMEIERYVLNETLDRMVLKPIMMPNAAIQLFVEILSNATDNYTQSIIQGIEGGDININVDQRGYISIENFGLNLKVRKIISVKTETMKKTKEVPDDSKDPKAMWLPEFIFGTMNTSDNYDDDVKRMSVGRNGIGAKAVNIFSKEFIVEADDPENKKNLILKWKDNMFVNDDDAKPEAQLTVNKKIKRGRTKITYLIDKDYFKMYPNKYEYIEKREIKEDKDVVYTQDDVLLFARIAAESSFANKIVINFSVGNHEEEKEYIKLDYINILDFSTLVFGKEEKSSLSPSKDKEEKSSPSKEQKEEINYHIDYSWVDKNDPLKIIDIYSKLSKKEKSKIVSNPKNIEEIPQLEILIMDTPKEGKVFSYVNGQMTANGGIHVTAVLNKIFKKILDDIKAIYKKENPNVEEKILAKYNINKISEHFSFIINAKVPNPGYKNQTKDQLAYIGIGKSGKNSNILKYDPSQDMTKVEKWDSFLECLTDLKQLDGRDYDKKNSVKKDRYVFIKKLSEAGEAGGPNSKKCTLWVTEGDSAKKYIDQIIGQLEDRTKYHGVLPLRGKITNVRKIIDKKDTIRKILAKDVEKSELVKLITALGAKVSFDMIERLSEKKSPSGKTKEKKEEKIDYRDKKTRDSLRYGSIIIAADADVDGSHIRCLVTDIFSVLFPGLIESGFVKYFKTGVARLKPKVKTSSLRDIIFYSLEEYNEWEKNHSGEIKKYKNLIYTKGLAGNATQDIKDDIKSFSIIRMYQDDNAEESLNVAFGKNANLRKKWIEEAKTIDLPEICNNIVVDKKYYETFGKEEYQPINFLGEDTEKKKKDDKVEIKIIGENISRIVNGSLRVYSIASISRAVIGYDFLKESQRLAVYHILNYFNYKHGESGAVLNRLASDVASKGFYIHGSNNLEKTILLLAEYYTGSNNMPFFAFEGLAGDKKDKEAAASRYTSVNLPEWIDLIMEKEIIEFVPKLRIEGHDVCPKWIPQVIPLGLVNGDNGMSTGYSFYTPCYNPMDVADWFIARCENKKPKSLFPWYNGFENNHKIRITERNTGASKMSSPVEEDTSEDNDEEDDDDLKEITKGKYTVQFEGNYHIEEDDGNKKIIITELCPNQYITDYTSFFMTQFEDYTKTKIPKFCIGCFQGYHSVDIRGKGKHEKSGTSFHYKPDIKLTICPGKPKNKDEAIKFSKGLEYIEARNSVNLKSLRLITKKNLSNIVITDQKGFAAVHDDVHEVADIYYNMMCDNYKDYVIWKIKEAQGDLEEYAERMKYIRAIINKDLIIMEKEEEVILERMKELGIKNDINGKNIYGTSMMKDANKNSIAKLEKKIKEINDFIKKYKKYTPQTFWLERLYKLKEFLEATRKKCGGEFYCF